MKSLSLILISIFLLVSCGDPSSNRGEFNPNPNGGTQGQRGNSLATTTEFHFTFGTFQTTTLVTQESFNFAIDGNKTISTIRRVEFAHATTPYSCLLEYKAEYGLYKLTAQELAKFEALNLKSPDFVIIAKYTEVDLVSVATNNNCGDANSGYLLQRRAEIATGNVMETFYFQKASDSLITLVTSDLDFHKSTN